MNNKAFHIVVVGGGVSGISAASRLATAYLARRDESQGGELNITIIEPSEKLGGPLYNTPAINAFVAQPFDKIGFRLPHKQDVDATLAPDNQISYQQYGQYLRTHLDELCTYLERLPAPVHVYTESRGGSKKPFMRAEVVDAWETGNHAQLKLNDGRVLEADVVVIATGNPPPEELRDSKGRALSDFPGYYRRYQDGLAPKNLHETDQMALVGMGASAHTFVAAAERNGYKGHILLASRRGKSPELEYKPPPERPHILHHFTLDVLQDMQRQNGSVSAEEFWDLFQKEVRHARPLGYSRQEVADACFDDFNAMTQVMSVAERTKFAEKFGAEWNFMANRIPAVHREILGKLTHQRRLHYREKMVSIDPVDEGGFTIAFNDGKQPAEVTTPKIVNCTGPSIRIADMSPLLRHMQQRGLVEQHPLAGITVDRGLRLKNTGGESSKIFYALGPPTQGEFFESVSVPAIQKCTDILVESVLHDHGLIKEKTHVGHSQRRKGAHDFIRT